VAESRKLAAILVSDVVGYSRLAGVDEDRTLARLRALRSDLIDPITSMHRGRMVKRTGDGSIVEFRSVVDAVRCAIEVQSAMVERNAGLARDRRIEFRIGIHLGDVVEEADGDLMGDGVNIAARLESVAEPGGICLSEDAYRQVRDKIEVSFADLGEKGLKNIARPTRVFGLDAVAIAAAPQSVRSRAPDDATIASPKRGLQPRHRRTSATFAVVTVLLVLAGAASLWIWRGGGPIADGAGAPGPIHDSSADHPSIAVMPLANLSGDPAQDYFADGLTEDIISALGRFPDITVISRSAALAYKGKSARPDAIGRELNVAYLVDGSVRKTGERARVSVELLEAAGATVLWTRQYDREIKDLLTIQDDIARQVAGALSVRLTALQLARSASKPPSNLKAYDLVLRGRDLSLGSRRDQSEARQLFERAIELDPGYAPAYAGLGRLDVYAAEGGYTNDPDSALARAEANGRKALSNDENVGAHILLGRIYIFRGDYDRALDELRHAVELNPSDPEAQSGLADALLWSGNAGAAIETMREVARVQPILTDDENVDLGIAYLIADRPDDAIAALGRAIQRYGQSDVTLHALLASAYATAGRKAEAANEAEIVKQMLPSFAAKDFATQLRDEGQRSKVIAALQLAGL
jgi:TolB-like protein/class 3 adenylate cyclase/Flp pilus assembly protein TadD